MSNSPTPSQSSTADVGRLNPSTYLFLALVVFASTVAWRIHLWQRVPGFSGTEGSTQTFVWENAIQYRYARMVAVGADVPETDPMIEWPTGVKPYQDFSFGMEAVEGGLYRWLGLSMNFPFYLACVATVVSALSLLACYAGAWLQWRSHAAALVAMALFALCFPTFGRTIGTYLREHFSLPFLLAGFVLGMHVVRMLNEETVRPRSWILAVCCGACWAVALSTWHVSRFLFLAMLGFWTLEQVLRPSGRGIARMLAASLPVLLLASFWNPMLRHQGFWHAAPMLAAYGLLLASALPFPATPNARRASTLLLPLLAVIVGLAVSPPASYSHVGAMLLAKVMNGGAYPADPAALPFEARVLWIGAFQSPNAFILVYAYGPILLAGLIGCMLARRETRLDNSRAIDSALVYPLLVFGAGFLLMIRLGPLLAFFLAIAGGGLVAFHWRSSLSRNLAIGLISFVLLIQTYQCAVYRTGNDRLAGLVASVLPQAATNTFPGWSYEFQRVQRWFSRETNANDAILAHFGTSCALLLQSQRPVTLHAKFETPTIRDRVREYFQALYGPETSLVSYCEKYDVKYVLHEPSLVLLDGPQSPLYWAGHTAVPAESAALTMHFWPEDLSRFRLVYENSRYRIYKFVRDSRDKGSFAPAYTQRLFDPASFDIAQGDPFTPSDASAAIGVCLATEGLLRQGLALYSQGRTQEAGDALSRALRAHPGLPLGRPILAELLLQRDQPEAALDAARKGVRCEPDVAAAWRMLGECHLANGNAKDAQSAFARAEALAPNSPGPQAD